LELELELGGGGEEEMKKKKKKRRLMVVAVCFISCLWPLFFCFFDIVPSLLAPLFMSNDRSLAVDLGELLNLSSGLVLFLLHSIRSLSPVTSSPPDARDEQRRGAESLRDRSPRRVRSSQTGSIELLPWGAGHP
jgi:hypothetical protein